MAKRTAHDDPDLHRLVVRSAKEWLAALGEKPAGVPVWRFPLRAMEIANELAGGRSQPDPNPMSAELCLELLAYTPIRLRSCDGVEVTTCLAQWAGDTEQTVLEVIEDFQLEYERGELRWEQADDDGFHIATSVRGHRP